MVTYEWSKEVLADPVTFADQVELALAFHAEDYGHVFAWSDFKRDIGSELLNARLTSYVTGGQADDFSGAFADLLALIERRHGWLGDAYPFRRVDGEIHFTPSDFYGKQNLLYLMLLVCTYHTQSEYSSKELTVAFEDICKEAMKCLFPSHADVFAFSQNSDDRKNMGWSARDAVPALANKLNAAIESLDRIPDHQSEFGIDIVAICGFDDDLPYPFFALAQCTIGKRWWEKRHEAIAQNSLEGYMSIKTNHSNFLFIPHFPQFDHDKWSARPDQTINCIICDRHRIFTLLKSDGKLDDPNLPPSVSDVFLAIASWSSI